MLFEFYKAQRDSFNESYQKMTMGTFTVKVDGRDFTVRPSDPNVGTFVGVLYDSEGTVKDLDKKLNDSSYTLPTLFNWLNAARTILEGGDFWLLLLGGILLLIFKAAAPLMMAVAIDQKLAHKVSYPFVWGCVVLTLIWPAVSTSFGEWPISSATLPWQSAMLSHYTFGTTLLFMQSKATLLLRFIRWL